MPGDAGQEIQIHREVLRGEKREIDRPLLLTLGRHTYILSVDSEFVGFDGQKNISSNKVGIYKKFGKIWDGGKNEKRFLPLAQDKFRFGRNVTNDIVSGDPRVSRNQAFLSVGEDGKIYITDGDGEKASSNGTDISEIKPASPIKEPVTDEEPAFFLLDQRPVAIYLGNEKVVIKRNERGQAVAVNSIGKELSFTFNEQAIGELTLGRNPIHENNINNPKVSKTHAILRLNGDVLEVIDLASTNGTYVTLESAQKENSSNAQRKIIMQENVKKNDKARLTQIRDSLQSLFRRREPNNYPIQHERDLIDNLGILGKADHSWKNEGNKSNEEIAAEVKSFVDDALELLKEGKAQEAIKHLRNYEKAVSLGQRMGFGGGELQYINKLLSDDDVILGARHIAEKSRMSKSGAFEIAPYVFREFGKNYNDFPEYFNQEYVNKFLYEVGLIYSEEWLHYLQLKSGKPIAGQTNSEVDIAAYFYSKELPLSEDFLTRYPERKDWYEKQKMEIRTP